MKFLVIKTGITPAGNIMLLEQETHSLLCDAKDSPQFGHRYIGVSLVQKD